ncbi:hydantoinase B/oxoprolinase family protein [Gluconacetobacter sacchari]|uniref:hydantoinase B/oxoprolinase family protein n=1 Tax=Gluconacetobacter sacchari TaxID=92759 RepID=UPI0039B4F8B7
MTNPMCLDPFVIEVIRNALTAAAEEMSAVVMRSARSPLLREAGDLSSVLTDARGQLIAQGHDVPVHLGVLNFTVKSFLSIVPESSLRPGDIWFLNLPEVGGNHLPDVKAIRPIYHEGHLVCFAVSLAHWADIGGAVPGSYYAAASDAWMEGLRIPPLRVFADDRVDPEKLSIVLANVRGRVEREGDLLAQAAAACAGGRRVLDIIARYGRDVFLASLDALHDLSESQMRGLLSALPDGLFEGEDFLDDDGRGGDPVAIRVRIEKTGDTARFDFSGSDDAVIGPLNTTRFVAGSAVFYAIRALADSEIQPNGGCYRPLEIVTRPGSVVDAGPEKPLVGGNHETSQRMVDAIFLALSGAVSEKLSAGGHTSAGLVIFSGPTSGGRWLTFYETHGGGEGARIDRDGYPVVRVHLTNVMSTPVEVVEAEYPMLRVERQILRDGSGGAGAHRGGDGMIRDYRIMAPEVTVTTMFERRVIPPYGLKGGEAGARMRVTHVRSGQERVMAGKENAALAVGDLIRVETPGGGGYGMKVP